jgi:hypothetical protein
MTATYRTPRSLTGNPATRQELLNPAARLGLTARAFVYLLIGLLAILVATGRSTAETDQWGAMQQLNHRTFGHVVLWVVAVGLAAYALWRFSEAAFGAAGDGHKTSARLKSFARGCIYSVLAANGFQIAAGGGSTSQSGRQQTMAAKVMLHSGGRLAVGVVGAVIVVAGLVLVYEGLSRRFEKYLAMSSMSPPTRRAVEVLGVVGTAARGAVFALAGAFLIQAATDYKPAKAAGLDGALRSLRDRQAGPWLLGAAAVGLIAFGLYGFAEARWRHT